MPTDEVRQVKYTHGYDPFSYSWIVGPATEDGTIAARVAWFVDAAEANANAEKLNAGIPLSEPSGVGP